MLSELLRATEPVFSIALQHLERSTGNPSADIRLQSEIIGKVHEKAKQLIPNAKTLSAEELYAGLVQKVREHDETLVRAIGGYDAGETKDVQARVLKAIQKLDIDYGCLALKSTSVKQMLKSKPPKQTMKLLGYKSLDSMVKREHLARIYYVMRLVESQPWLKAYYAQYKTLTALDFEPAVIEVVTIDTPKWRDISQKLVLRHLHNVGHINELGAIVVLPMPVERMRGLAITLMPLILHYIAEIRMYSAYFKLHQMKPDFGKVLVQALTHDDLPAATVANHDIHWRILHRYYGTKVSHPAILEPHVQPEDLAWRHAGRVLAHFVPDLLFWHDLDYVGLNASDGPVSFNLMDVAINYTNKLSYDQRVSYHMRDALWNEILMRYVGQDNFKEAVLQQLDNLALSDSLGSGILVGEV